MLVKYLHNSLSFCELSDAQNEKISIIQVASAEIRKLEKRKEELEKRNSGMVDLVAREGIMGGVYGEGGGGKRRAKIRVRVDNPTSGIDSLQEVLKCLKHMGLSASGIGFELSKLELSAVIEIDNEEVVTLILINQSN